MGTRVVDSQWQKRGQQFYLRKVVEMSGARLLVDVTVDSLVPNSRASVSHWHAGAWQEVYTLLGEALKVDFKMALRKEVPGEGEVESVVERLLNVAKDVLLGTSQLVVYLEGSTLASKAKLPDGNGRELDVSSLSTICLRTMDGTETIAQGPFSEVAGMLHVATPLEPEAYKLIPIASIAGISYSE